MLRELPAHGKAGADKLSVVEAPINLRIAARDAARSRKSVLLLSPLFGRLIRTNAMIHTVVDADKEQALSRQCWMPSSRS
jgi:hypothetical protein